IAGLLAAHAKGDIVPGSTIVCTVTGHGLKDPDRATADIEIPASVPPSLDAVKAIIDSL
ncbi:MAG TPA: threonine synthase, partial [Acidimicrobiia bacterium]|nr:threonine synthase [Acidimicrobiia bacterium]